MLLNNVGINRSGKTTVLNLIKKFLTSLENEQFKLLDNWKKSVLQWQDSIDGYEIQEELSDEDRGHLQNIKSYLRDTQNNINQYNGVSLTLKNQINGHDLIRLFKEGKFIIVQFNAKRQHQSTLPQGINKIQLPPFYGINDDSPNRTFLQYLVNLRAQKSFARDEDDHELVLKIEVWFTFFEESLKDIFEDPSLKLEFDVVNFNYNIILKNREKFDFTTLSDGFSSFLNIFTDLIIRMENNKTTIYDVQGIVLIDEIETHLHVSLQKKILPFLEKCFPNIQFIVTTHSPFVLNSIENAIVYDLENHITLDQASAYSYKSLVENYFNVDMYSKITTKKIQRYEYLINKVEISHIENIEMLELNHFLESIPEFLAPELKMKFQFIEWNREVTHTD